MDDPVRRVGDFTALPVKIKVPTYPYDAVHYIYIKEHEPQIADEDAPRSLFLVNIPVTTQEIHLKHLFATQLAAGRVERVDFSSTTPIAISKSSKKRKRMTAEELEAGLDARHPLPQTLEGQIHASGSTAIVVFIDKPSMKLSLKAARSATKKDIEIVWGAGLPKEKTPVMGLKRYEAYKLKQYPDRASLLRAADQFMTAYGEMEEARARENARKRQMPDEDGFVTVTRGSKGGGGGGVVLKKNEAEEMKEKQKIKQKGLEDFYRFQMREKRKEKHGELLRKFEDDKKRVAAMRLSRGRPRPET